MVHMCLTFGGGAPFRIRAGGGVRTTGSAGSSPRALVVGRVARVVSLALGSGCWCEKYVN